VFLGAEGRAKQFKELHSDDGILLLAQCRLGSGGHFIKIITKDRMISFIVISTLFILHYYVNSVMK